MNAPNRTLLIADNLPMLHGVDSEAVGLIATDPPFNKSLKAFEGHYCGWTEHQLLGCLDVGMQSH